MESANIVSEPCLVTPFTSMVVGPTGCGKTFGLLHLINNANITFTTMPCEIHLCYGEDQPAYDKHSIPIIKHQGLIPAENLFENDGRHRLLVIDDLMDEAKTSNVVEAVFTKQSHHMNLSVIFIAQTLFNGKKRTMSVNSNYFLLFKNPRDSLSIQNFARQAYPGNTRFVTESYADATREPHSCLLVDMTQTAPTHMRLIGEFLNPEKHCTAYTPLK